MTLCLESRIGSVGMMLGWGGARASISPRHGSGCAPHCRPSPARSSSPSADTCSRALEHAHPQQGHLISSRLKASGARRPAPLCHNLKSLHTLLAQQQRYLPVWLCASSPCTRVNQASHAHIMFSVELHSPWALWLAEVDPVGGDGGLAPLVCWGAARAGPTDHSAAYSLQLRKGASLHQAKSTPQLRAGGWHV